MFTKFPIYWQMMSDEQGGGHAGTGDTGAPAAGVAPGGADPNGAASQGGESAAPQDGPTTQAYWPGDWRDQITGGDETLSKRAGRYASPAEMFKALVAAQNKIRSGELRSSLPDNATEEEVKAWREENGIPTSPEGYDLNFDSGLVIGDDDRPVVDSFLAEVAHKHNLPPSVAKAAVEWYYNQQQDNLDQMAEADLNARQQAMDALNVEWGPEYRRNINMISGVIDTNFPEGVRDAIKSARLPDGTALFNNADVLKGFANLALEINPAGTLVPSGMGDPSKSIDGEIAEIESFMRKSRTEYFKDEKKQARYRELLQAREKLQQRAS